MLSTFSSFRISTQSLVSSQNIWVLTLLSADEPTKIIRDVTLFIQCNHLWAKHKCLLLLRCPKAKLWTWFPIHSQMLPFLVKKVDPVLILDCNHIFLEMKLCISNVVTHKQLFIWTQIIRVSYLVKCLRNNVFKMLKIHFKKDDWSDQK